MNASHHREAAVRSWENSPVLLTGAPRSAYLDLRVYLTNGEAARFVQTDTEMATRVVEQARPDRAFARPHLTMADGNRLTTFPTDGIERIDLLTNPMPSWHREDSQVREVAQEGMALGLDCKMVLRSGAVVHLDISQARRDNAPLPMDFSLFVTRLFSGKCLVGETEGGLFLINPANIVRMDTFPSTAMVMPGSWRARQLSNYATQFGG